MNGGYVVLRMAVVRRSRGRRPDERPFNASLTLKPSSAAFALVPGSLSNRASRAALSILANLIVASREGQNWVFYSRDRNAYAGQRRYRPSWQTLAAMTQAVEALEWANVVEHRRTRPSPSAILRSAIRPTRAFELDLGGVPPGDLIETQREVIVLRSKSRQLVDYRDSSSVRQLRRDVLEHNEFLAMFEIGIDHIDAQCDASNVAIVRGHRLDLQRRQYRRIFNGDFSHGGRWYGPFWQHLPSRIRAGLRIDRSPVIEIDYQGCHPHLMAAWHGIALPVNADPYERHGYERRHMKRAFNILLNAKSFAQARRAIANRFIADWGRDSYHKSVDLIQAVQAQFPGLERSWLAGFGGRLQNIDADICARVQRKLRRAGVPCLSVHDSFIVPILNSQQLRSIMDDEFNKKQQQLRKVALNTSDN